MTTEDTLLKETNHGDEGYSGVGINTEDEKADIYIGQGSEVNENKDNGISITNVDEIMTDTSKNGNAKHATSKSVNELMDKKDNDMTFTTLKNFDRKTIKELLVIN